KQRSSLVTTGEHSDYRFAVELLGALEKVGDARAIPIVQRSAQAWQEGALVEAANRALITLEERRRLETERATLLRGAGTPGIAEEELLRASISQADGAPEELLRPV